MAVPKRKTSKARKAKRRTHFKLEVPGLNTCPNCGSLRKATMFAHHVDNTMEKKLFLKKHNNNNQAYTFV